MSSGSSTLSVNVFHRAREGDVGRAGPPVRAVASVRPHHLDTDLLGVWHQTWLMFGFAYSYGAASAAAE
jgi:hypothetical protein